MIFGSEDFGVGDKNHLLELGAGFAFGGRQYHLEIGEEDIYWHITMQRK